MYDPVEAMEAPYSRSTELQNKPIGSLIPDSDEQQMHTSTLAIEEMRKIGEVQQELGFMREYNPSGARDPQNGSIPCDPTTKKWNNFVELRSSKVADATYKRFASIDDPALSWNY